MSDETWDVVVVGGGAGGLSTALTLARARRRVLVVDAGDPRNAPAEGVHNYLGREGTAPGELVAIGRAEVEGYGGVVRAGRVTSAAVSDGGGFEIGLQDGDRLRARRLVVATGVADELPDVPGLRERWGTDVLHCPYCHGWEVRDRRIGVLATSPLALHQVQLLRQWSDDVVLLVNDALALDHHSEAELAARGIEVVPGKVTGLVVGNGASGATGEDQRLDGATLADGTTVRLDALAVAPVSRARAEVPTMLGLPVVEQWVGASGATGSGAGDVLVGDVVETQPGGATAVDGLWVVGNAADLRAVVITAAASGTAVAAAVNADLVAEDVRLALNASRDGSPEFWERFYAGREQIWSGRVNATVGDVADTLEPGTALDLGAGEGGDALWLAERGWKVTAVDVSQTACDRIAGLAGDLPVTTERHDLTATFPEGTFDLVTASYLHSPNDDFPRRAILRRAAEAVAPGGTLLVVGHGRLAPWSWDPSLRMATAAEVLEGLGLGEVWEVRRCESAERTVTGPDEQEATITDEVVAVRKRR